MTPNRIVAVLTPLVFAPAAGAISAWVAKHAPGVELSSQELTNIFIAGALVALAPAAQWLHGWQKYEQREAETERAVAVAEATSVAAPVYENDAAEGDGGGYYDELDALEAAGEEDDEDPLIGEPVGAGAEG
jgi:hypothetical protein